MTMTDLQRWARSADERRALECPGCGGPLAAGLCRECDGDRRANDYVATGRRGPALSEEDWFAAYWRRRLLFLLLENRGLATLGWWRPRPDEGTHGA